MGGVLALGLQLACGGGSAPKPPKPPAILALLKDGTLLTFVPGRDRPDRELRIGTGEADSAGRYLALDRGRSKLYVIVSRGRGGSELAIVDLGDGDVERRLSLGARSRFRTVAVGSRSGKLYLFGNRRDAAVLRIIAPAEGRVLADRTFRTDRPGWDVVSGTISEDERFAYASYHGDAEGVDRMDLRTGRLPCVRQNAHGGCLEPHVHGDVAWHDGALVATTGNRHLLRIAPDGRGVAHWDTRLTDDHVMSFAFDPRNAATYVAGSCRYRGGYSVIAGDGAVRTLVSTGDPQAAAPGRPCGDRFAVGGTPLVGVLAQTRLSAYDDVARGALAIVDPRAGKVTRTIELRAPPVDVFVADALGRTSSGA